jgi:hypothetical protein
MRSRAWPLLLAMPGAALASDLIGRTVPPYPAGLQDIAGSCLSDSTEPARVCDYAISLLADADDSAANDADGGMRPRYIIASRLSGRDGQHAQWTITDALPYPLLVPGFQLQVGNCRAMGKADRGLAALASGDERGQWLDRIAWARRLDFASGTFQPVSGKVDCLNEAYPGL